MRLIIIGSEYSGTTTLANAVNAWAEETIGITMLVHDHWKIPHTINHPSDMTEEEQAQYVALSPRIKEAAQRHNLYYHTPASRGADGIYVGYYMEDTIYAQLYYGYGGDGSPGDRRVHSHSIEQRNMEFAPETVLVLVKASPEVIRARLTEKPHQPSVLQEKDIEVVLQMFEDAYKGSAIKRKFTLDTSAATVEKTIAQFERQIEPHLTENDRLRILTRRLSQ